MNGPKIIATDFDGTLCIGDHYPGIGEPNLPVIMYLKKHQETGGKIVLWTCRSGEPLRDAVEWCYNHGLIFDAINENLPETLKWMGTDSRKIFAHEYLDDRALNPNDIDTFYADNLPVSKSGSMTKIAELGDNWVLYLK